MLVEAGHGTTLDLIYARGVPNTPSPDPTSIDKKKCTLIIVEIGFYMTMAATLSSRRRTRNTSPSRRP